MTCSYTKWKNVQINLLYALPHLKKISTLEGKSLLIYSKGYLIKNKDSSAMFILRRCSNILSLSITQHEVEKNPMPLPSLLPILCPLCFHVHETAVHNKVK